jgi:hypothetical protein
VFDDAKKAGIELELVDIGGGFSVCFVFTFAVRGQMGNVE